ncbi:hypothetical protein EDD16DRAFT_1726953 [Pisolithus croceorrhizus]|nr:hypothetical protein EDD16DRAFT_1726953 [Pisolithus croceorrhizus]
MPPRPQYGIHENPVDTRAQCSKSARGRGIRDALTGTQRMESSWVSEWKDRKRYNRQWGRKTSSWTEIEGLIAKGGYEAWVHSMSPIDRVKDLDLVMRPTHSGNAVVRSMESGTNPNSACRAAVVELDKLVNATPFARIEDEDSKKWGGGGPRRASPSPHFTFFMFHYRHEDDASCIQPSIPYYASATLVGGNTDSGLKFDFGASNPAHATR